MSFFRKIGNNIMNVGEHMGMQGNPPNSLVGKQIQVGAYKLRVEKQIGEGGYAIIYLVRDVDKGTTYALKHFTRLDEQTDRKSWVEQEARIMAKLRHCPYILRLLSVGFTFPQDRPGVQIISDGFYVMDLCSYGLVDYSQQRNWELEEATIFEIITQTCQALKYMHQQNPPLTHRDVKAENILRHPDNRWVLCDFGSTTSEAKVYNDPYERSIMEDNIRRFTTPPYRPPEMWDLYSRKMVGPKGDVWAVGCMLYLLLYKQLPFTGESGIPIINGSYPQRSHRYQSLANLIKYILVVDPDQRPDIIQLIAKIEEAKQFKQREQPQQQQQQHQYTNFANFPQQPANQFSQKAAQNNSTFQQQQPQAAGIQKQQQQQQQVPQQQPQAQKPKIQEFANFDMTQSEPQSQPAQQQQQQQPKQQQAQQESLGRKASESNGNDNALNSDAFAPLFDAFGQNTPEQVREQLQKANSKQPQNDKQGTPRRKTEGPSPYNVSNDLKGSQRAKPGMESMGGLSAGTFESSGVKGKEPDTTPALNNQKKDIEQEISLQNLTQKQGTINSNLADSNRNTDFDSFAQFGATFNKPKASVQQDEIGFSESNPFKQSTTNEFIDTQEKDLDDLIPNSSKSNTQPQDPFFASSMNNQQYQTQANTFNFENDFKQNNTTKNTYNDNLEPNIQKETFEVKPVLQEDDQGSKNGESQLQIQYQQLKQIQKESKLQVDQQQKYIESLERDLQDQQNTERIRLQKMNFQNQELQQLRQQVNEQIQIMDERSSTVTELLDKLEQVQIENIRLNKRVSQLQQQSIPQRSGSYTSNEIKGSAQDVANEIVSSRQNNTNYSYTSPKKYATEGQEASDFGNHFTQDKLHRHNQEQEEQDLRSYKSNQIKGGLQQGLSSLSISKQQNQQLDPQMSQQKQRQPQQQQQQYQQKVQPNEPMVRETVSSQGQYRGSDMSRKTSNLTEVQNIQQQQQQGQSGTRQPFQLNANLDPSLVQKHLTKQGGAFWDKFA